MTKGATLSAVEILPVDSPSLTELGDLANREHELVGTALSSAVTHAVQCGFALLQARELAGKDSWAEWVAGSLNFGPDHAKRYMRLAFHKDALPPEIFEPYADRQGQHRPPSMLRAMNYLRGLPPVTAEWTRKKSPEFHREVRRLHQKEGLSYKAIARLTGVADVTVARICTPGAAKRERDRGRRRRQEARRAAAALARQDDQTAARSAGGATAEAYSLIRRAALQLDEAVRQAQKPATRKALRNALAALHKTEDAISQALRTD